MDYTGIMEETLETNIRPTTVKTYPFRLSPILIAVLILGLGLSATLLGITVWRTVNYVSGGVYSTYEWIQLGILLFMSVLVLALVISILLRSRYVLTGDKLILWLGFIRTTYYIKNIYSIRLYKGSARLAVYFDDYHTKYAVIVIKPALYDDFTKCLMERNPRIEYDFITAEEENELKKKK